MPILFDLSKFPNKYFIETGTYLGEGIEKALDSNSFKYIYSIEIDTLRHLTAKETFSRYDNVTLIRGDSGELLKLVLKHINEPCTFWLDAHFNNDEAEYGSKWCPLIEELNAIKNHSIKNHTIIIDDYRCMDNTHFDKERNIPVGFPGKKNLINILKSINPDYSIKFLDGVVPNDVVVARVDYEEIAQISMNKILNILEYEEKLDNEADLLVNKIIKESKYEVEFEGEIIAKSIINQILDKVNIIVHENREERLKRKEEELIKWEEELREREIEPNIIIVEEILIDKNELLTIQNKLNDLDEELLKKEQDLLEKEKILKEKEEELEIKELTFKEMILDLHLQTQIKHFNHLEKKATARDARKQKRKRQTKSKKN